MIERLFVEHDHIQKTLNLLEIQFLGLCYRRNPGYSIMLSIVAYMQEYAEDYEIGSIITGISNERFVWRRTMIHAVKDSVSSILENGNAKAGEHWIDSFENEWVVHEDRDGFWLEASDGKAIIPYWTTYVIQLPGLHRLSA